VILQLLWRGTTLYSPSINCYVLLLQFNGGLLVDDDDLSIRCKLIRADYEPSGGEAFLTWRKGAGCATYHFGVRVEVQCLLRVDGRVLGQAKGVAWFHDVNVRVFRGNNTRTRIGL